MYILFMPKYRVKNKLIRVQFKRYNYVYRYLKMYRRLKCTSQKSKL